MKNVKVFILLILLVFILYGCGQKNEMQVNKNEDIESSKNVPQSITRNDIEKQWDGNNSVFYICEENSDVVTGNIPVKNKNFISDFVFFSSLDENKILTLYINDKQVEFEVNGSKNIAQTISFNKGKNELKIKASNQIKTGVNSAVLVISNCENGKGNDDGVLYTNFNIIDNEITKTEQISNLIENKETENKAPYEVLGENKKCFSYFNLSLDSYKKEMFKDENDEIHANFNETITIPIEIGSNAINDSRTIGVIIDGIEIEKEQLSINEKDKAIYIPLKCKISKPAGKHIMNILITGTLDNSVYLERSQDIMLEVN